MRTRESVVRYQPGDASVAEGGVQRATGVPGAAADTHEAATLASSRRRP